MYFTCATTTMDPKTLELYLQILADDPDLLMEMIAKLPGVECKEQGRRQLGFRGRRVFIVTLSFTKGMMTVARTFPPNDAITKNKKWSGWRTIEKFGR